jgi:hypothetical protein
MHPDTAKFDAFDHVPANSAAQHRIWRLNRVAGGLEPIRQRVDLGGILRRHSRLYPPEPSHSSPKPSYGIFSLTGAVHQFRFAIAFEIERRIRAERNNDAMISSHPFEQPPNPPTNLLSNFALKFLRLSALQKIFHSVNSDHAATVSRDIKPRNGIFPIISAQ